MKDKRQTMTDVNRVFNTPFIVQEKTVLVDKYKVEKEVWADKYKLFADGKSIYGKEYEIARQTNTQKQVKLIIKEGPKIDESMRIILLNRVYDIDSIDNIGFKNELLEIKAIERSLDEHQNQA